MGPVAIPGWNARGLIPPVSDLANSTADRSPYCVSLCEFVLRYATSSRRQQILSGYLRHRSLLHSAGLTDGFQWIDGSFLENIEVIELRDPNDIDVVTFFSLPQHLSQQEVLQRVPLAFSISRGERAAFKAEFFVDPYFVSLKSRELWLVQQATYWYSMWSHRRDASWKGYLQLDLDPLEDQRAAAQLTLPTNHGEFP